MYYVLWTEGDVRGTGRRAQGTGHRAQGAGHRIQGIADS